MSKDQKIFWCIVAILAVVFCIGWVIKAEYDRQNEITRAAHEALFGR